jgi:hypothetical protein
MGTTGLSAMSHRRELHGRRFKASGRGFSETMYAGDSSPPKPRFLLAPIPHEIGPRKSGSSTLLTAGAIAVVQRPVTNGPAPVGGRWYHALYRGNRRESPGIRMSSSVGPQRGAGPLRQYEVPTESMKQLPESNVGKGFWRS